MNCTILLDGHRIARWQLECVELLRRQHRVDVRVLDGSAPRASAALLRRLLGGGALRERAVPVQREAVAADVVLDLRSTGACDPSVAAPVYWYFCDGAGRRLGLLPGAAEIESGSPTLTIELREWSASGGAVSLRRGRFKVLYTYARTMDVALAECRRWPAIALEGFGRSRGDSPTAKAGGAPGAAPAPRALRLAARFARALASHCFTHLFVDARWEVGLVSGSPKDFLAPDYAPQIRWLDSHPREFLADPFLFRLPGRRYLFGERIDPRSRNGFISCLTLAEGGEVLGERAVLRAAHHLSYPFVFEDAGSWYMVPESAQDRRVVLYRAAELPHRWERVATILDGVAACDSTIVRHGGRWWLFCTDRLRDANLNLFLYSADDPRGPWRPHPANPVKTDIRSARPAGTPFLVDGVLYRPGQDCAAGYGDAISFNRVTVLNEREFSEEPVSTFRRGEPGGPGRGSHTISYADGVVAIDAKTTIYADAALVRRRLFALASRAWRSAA